jgi:hypothetical protein
VVLKLPAATSGELIHANLEVGGGDLQEVHEVSLPLLNLPKLRISCLTSSSIRGPFVLILLLLLSLGRSWHHLHFTYALPRAAAYLDRAGTRNRSKRSSVRYRFSSVSYIVEFAFHALG